MNAKPILHVDAHGPALDQVAAAVKLGNNFTKSQATDDDIRDALEIYRLPQTAENIGIIRTKVKQ